MKSRALFLTAALILSSSPLPLHAEAAGTAARPAPSGISGFVGHVPCAPSIAAGSGDVPRDPACRMLAIRGATVVFVNQATNRRAATRTDEAGLFRRRLPAGEYFVSVLSPAGLNCSTRFNLSVRSGYSTISLNCVDYRFGIE